MSKSTAPLRNKLIKRDGMYCHYCGKEMDMDLSQSNLNGVTVEHMNPKIKGGDNDMSNLVLSCRSCNSKKRTKHYQEFKMAIDTDATLLFVMGDES